MRTYTSRTVIRLFVPLLALALLLLLLVSLDEKAPTADVVIASENEVFTLDPQRMSYLADMRLAYALYEGLLRWDTDDFTLQPAAARDWLIEEDGRKLSFDLRETAYWSDGSPVTSHDFAWSWMRLLLPDTAADYYSLFTGIRGAKAFWSWRERQLQDFTADPWSAQRPGDRSRQARGLLRRFARLRSADDRPEGIAWVSDPDLTAEARLIEEALHSDADLPLAEALANAPAHRRAWVRLNQRSSREIEARWMWDAVEPAFRELVGISTPDDYRLVIELDQPVPYFPDLLAFAPTSPVHRPTVEGWTVPPDTASIIRRRGWKAVAPPPLEHRTRLTISPDTGRLIQSHGWAKPGILVGNGPYRLDQWRYKRDMQLSRSETYHDPHASGFRTIEIRSIPDPNTAVLAFLKGEVDWLTGVGADSRVELLAQRQRYDQRIGDSEDGAAIRPAPPPREGERRDIHAIPVFGTDFFSFNCRSHLADGRPNPFADAQVRRAFALACDKHAIVSGVTRLQEPVVSALVPPGSIPGYESPAGLDFDPEKARAELASAGWIDRDGDGQRENEHGEVFPDVELLYTTGSPRFSRMAVELRSQWQRELGIPVTLLGQDTKFFKDDLRKGNFMIARGRWYGDYGDPTTFLDLFRTGDGNNDRGFSHPRVDAALDAAARETDPLKRLQDLSQLESEIFREHVPLLPICQLVEITMYDPDRITGITHHPRLTHYLWNLRPSPTRSDEVDP